MRFMLSIVVVVTALTAARAQGADEIRVYRPDGSLQCGMGAERSLEEDSEALKGLGSNPKSAEKRTIPIRIIAVCGAPTGRVNTYVITNAEWDLILKSFMGPAGFAAWPYDRPEVTVYKYDGTLQCGLGREVALEAMQKELTDAGIKVFRARKSRDGLMHIMLCGAITGSINTYDIAGADLDRAAKIGFVYLTSPYDSLLNPNLLSKSEDRLFLMGEGLPLPWPFPW